MAHVKHVAVEEWDANLEAVRHGGLVCAQAVVLVQRRNLDTNRRKRRRMCGLTLTPR